MCAGFKVEAVSSIKSYHITTNSASRWQENSHKVLMMMKAASLVWPGAVEKSEQSDVDVDVGRNRADVVGSSMVVGSRPNQS